VLTDSFECSDLSQSKDFLASSDDNYDRLVGA